MHRVPHDDERADFPRTGSRARCLLRFERDLEAWLHTPEGRFAQFTARAAVAGDRVPEQRPA